MDAMLVLVLLPLVCAHVIGDFLLQTNRTVEAKQNLSVWALVWHAVQHGVLASVLCGAFGVWQIGAAVFVVHLAIDAAKERLLGGSSERQASRSSRVRLWAFSADQGAHVASLVAITMLLGGRVVDATPVWLDAMWLTWYQGVALATGWIVSVRMGSVVVGLLVEPFLSQVERERRAQASAGIASAPSRGLVGGGEAIGMLERCLIYVLMMSGMSAGVGFLIAAKSIFRFGELREQQNRMEAEYIIIGTFMSFGWAIVVAWGTGWVIGWVGGGGAVGGGGG